MDISTTRTCKWILPKRKLIWFNTIVVVLLGFSYYNQKYLFQTIPEQIFGDSQEIHVVVEETLTDANVTVQPRTIVSSPKHVTVHVKNVASSPNPPGSFIAEMEHPYLINSSDICSTLEPSLFLVIVHTATEHFERRGNIRKTWGNYQLLKNRYFKIVFLLGKPQILHIQGQIVLEANLHKDIVQGDFVDDYHNLTHKAVLGLRWVSEHCQQAKYVVKVDDDVFMNTFKLLHFLLHIDLVGKRRQIWCDVRIKGKRPIYRDGKSKVDEKDFPGLKYWPFTYCPGYIVIYTTDIIPELYTEAKRTKFLWLDDVYVTGILAHKIGNVTHVGLSNLNTHENTALECFRSKQKHCDLFVARAVAARDMSEMWLTVLRQGNSNTSLYLRNGVLETFTV